MLKTNRSKKYLSYPLIMLLILALTFSMIPTYADFDENIIDINNDVSSTNMENDSDIVENQNPDNARAIISDTTEEESNSINNSVGDTVTKKEDFYIRLMEGNKAQDDTKNADAIKSKEELTKSLQEKQALHSVNRASKMASTQSMPAGASLTAPEIISGSYNNVWIGYGWTASYSQGYGSIEYDLYENGDYSGTTEDTYMIHKAPDSVIVEVVVVARLVSNPGITAASQPYTIYPPVVTATIYEPEPDDITSTAITVAWGNGLVDGEPEYLSYGVLLKRFDDNSYVDFLHDYTNTDRGMELTFTGLSPDTAYIIEVDAGYTMHRGTSTAIYHTRPTSGISAPIIVRGTPGENSMAFSWIPSIAEDQYKYEDVAYEVYVNDVYLETVTDTTYTVLVTPGNKVKFEVKAYLMNNPSVNAMGTGGEPLITLSTPVFYEPNDDDITTDCITLSWSPSIRSDNNAEADNYYIGLYGSDDSIYYAHISSPTNTYDFTGLNPGVTYRIAIGATYMYYGANGEDIFVTTKEIKKIFALEPIEDIVIDVDELGGGATFEDLNLPDYVTAYVGGIDADEADEDTVEISVAWPQEQFDPFDYNNTQILTATLDLDGITNPDEVQATVNVLVDIDVTNIIPQIVSGDNFVVALAEDGTIYMESTKVFSVAQLNIIRGWNDNTDDPVVKIYAFGNSLPGLNIRNNVVGLTKDGRVKAEGSVANAANKAIIATWTEIADIAVGSHVIAGIKENGDVVAVHSGGATIANAIINWSGMKHIAIGTQHAVGIDKYGNWAWQGSSDYKPATINGSWNNIEIIDANASYTAGIDTNSQLFVSGIYGVSGTPISPYGPARTDSSIEISCTSNKIVYITTTKTACWFDVEFSPEDIADYGSDYNDYMSWLTPTNNWGKLVDITAGPEFIVAFDEDGEVFVCYSDNAPEINFANIANWSMGSVSYD